MSGKEVKVKRSVTLALVEEWSEGDQKGATAERIQQRMRRIRWSPRTIAAVIAASAALITAVIKILHS